METDNLRKYKIYLAAAREYADRVGTGISWLGAEEPLKQAARIFVKPILTFPSFRPGVTTTKEMIHGVIQVLTDINPRVMVGESDGG